MPLRRAATPTTRRRVGVASDPAERAQEMYRSWKQDPRSVHTSWDVYFSGMEKGMRSEDAFIPPPSLQPMAWTGRSQEAGPSTSTSQASRSDLEDHQKIQLLVRAYRAM